MSLYIGNWQCPYCEHWSYLNSGNIIKETFNFVGRFIFSGTICPNPKCHGIFAEIEREVDTNAGSNSYNPEWVFDKKWQLLPESSAKNFPTYVPLPIRIDYAEACKIKNLSPKAAATLARRALQGLIRDFWKITGKDNLKQEIKALDNLHQIDPDLIQAFHDVREVGNIRAHMEQDVNLIIDVDPDEAQILIDLLETAIEQTYIFRERKNEALRKLRESAEEKKSKKNQNTSPIKN